MSHYDAMDAHELRQELEEWTGRTLQWADDLVTAIDSQDIVTAALMAHAYKQARWQVRKIKHLLKLGVA